jgi:hypothetical protein
MQEGQVISLSTTIEVFINNEKAKYEAWTSPHLFGVEYIKYLLA